ncbi:hypothetical protein AB0L06_42595 [Spirillospora sp. NPDC052269]
MFPVVMVAWFLVLHQWNAGAFSAPETKTVPDPCLALGGQAQQALGAPSVAGTPGTKDIGGIRTSKCTWEKAAPSTGSLEVEYSLHRRSQGRSGADSARTEVDTDVRVDRIFPSSTTVTNLANLGDEAHQLVGRFGDTPGGLVRTTVVARRANVVIHAQSTGLPGPTPDQLKQLVAMALAGIKTG